MDAGTIATISTTLLTFLALIGYLRSEIKDFRSEITDVRDDVERLDDRVYALAFGRKPLIDQAERSM